MNEDTPQNLAHSSRSEAKLCAFIEALAEKGIVTDACKVAGFSRDYAYEVRGKDEIFAMLWNDAIARSGEPIIDPETKEQYVEYEYSDGLLTKMLAAYMPEMFGEKKEIKHSGNVTANIVTIVLPPDSEPIDQNGFMPPRVFNDSPNGTNGTH